VEKHINILIELVQPKHPVQRLIFHVQAIQYQVVTKLMVAHALANLVGVVQIAIP